MGRICVVLLAMLVSGLLVTAVWAEIDAASPNAAGEQVGSVTYSTPNGTPESLAYPAKDSGQTTTVEPKKKKSASALIGIGAAAALAGAGGGGGGSSSGSSINNNPPPIIPDGDGNIGTHTPEPATLALLGLGLPGLLAYARRKRAK